MSLKVVATSVNPNEGALLLAEVNQPGPGYHEPHRYQIIKVVRGDRVATYRKDLGPARLFLGTQFSIPGGQVDETTGRGEIWHSVGELQGMAEELRHRDSKKWAMENGAEIVDSSPEQWLEALHNEADRRRLIAEKQSIFGPAFSKMRY